MNQTKNQENFIDYEIWILIFGGAFQRAYVYNESATEKERAAFRKSLKAFVKENILPQYHTKVEDTQHIKNLEAIIKYSKDKHSSILKGKQLKLGVSQKLLNLALKYFWCIGTLAEPPHFPIDRIMLKSLGIKDINWTSLDSIETYKEIIAKANKVKNENETLAQWELRTFERR